MPRVSGIYSRPTGIDAVANNTIDSGKYNSNVADVEADLNLPRPIVAGGTGASDAAGARANLAAEVRGVVVTNYDTQVWESGSFCSFLGATGAPNSTHPFNGTCIVFTDPNYVTLEARDITDSTTPGRAYIREKKVGVWGPWTLLPGSTTGQYVQIAGDTMTGRLLANAGVKINMATPILELDAIGATISSIDTRRGGLLRWRIVTTDNATETGGNVGSDFGIARYNDAGNGIDFPLSINRATGNFSFCSQAPNLRPGFAGNTAAGVTIERNGSIFCSAAAFPPFFANININGNVCQFARSSVMVGAIDVTTTTTAYLTSSDGSLKEDLQPAGITASQILNDTEIFNFKWKATGERSYGVIAQQAAPIYGEPFRHNDDIDRWFVDYSKYVPILIQEAKTLKTRIADLEGRLNAGNAAALDVAIAVRNAMTAIPDTFTAVNFASMKIQLDALTEALVAMLQAQAPPP